jgi:hypothetical protein
MPRDFSSFGVSKGKNISTFQNLTPNIGAPKGFLGFGRLKGKKPLNIPKFGAKL